MPRRRKIKPVLGKDYTIDSLGNAQFTKDYLRSLGTCCLHACCNCPWKDKSDSTTPESRGDSPVASNPQQIPPPRRRRS